MAGYVNNTGKILIASAVARGVAGGPVTQEEKKGCLAASIALTLWQLTVLYALYRCAVGIYNAIFG